MVPLTESLAEKEYKRCRNLLAFSISRDVVSKYRNQFAARHIFTDGSVLVVNRRAQTMKWGTSRNNFLAECYLAYHPARCDKNGKFIPLVD